MAEPFRDNEHSVREQAVRLADDLYHLEHQLRLARTALEHVEDRLHPIRSGIFSLTTILVLVAGLVAGGMLAKTLGPPIVVMGHCRPPTW